MGARGDRAATEVITPREPTRQADEVDRWQFGVGVPDTRDFAPEADLHRDCEIAVAIRARKGDHRGAQGRSLQAIGACSIAVGSNPRKHPACARIERKAASCARWSSRCRFAPGKVSIPVLQQGAISSVADYFFGIYKSNRVHL